LSFRTELPKFPAFVAVELPPSLVCDSGDSAAFPEEAPSWLPPLPPKHSYVQTLSLSSGPVQNGSLQEDVSGARVAMFRFVYSIFSLWQRKSLVEGYLERAAKRSRLDVEAEDVLTAHPLVAPASIDQAWADAHAARQVRGTRLHVEQGPQDEDENEYQLRLKAERIVSRRDQGE
jgi:hypothetical protein